jgi:hypothetical protein
MRARRDHVRAAVVLDADGVRFLAVGRSHGAVLGQLAEYVAANAARLSPDDAARVRRRLARGALGTAVRHYVAAVGRRWDREWVEHHTVALPSPRPFRPGRVRRAPEAPRQAGPMGRASSPSSARASASGASSGTKCPLPAISATAAWGSASLHRAR